MEYASNMSAPAYPKRPGSPLAESSLPPGKIPRTQSSQLQINYLVRQRQETLPLVTAEERMPRVLQLIGEYDGVLQRHESMAGNLGACPLGPILLKRFERLFEGPPRVLKSHAKDPSMTWLDVVEFAQNRPEQFNLEKQRNGVRVCQFYHKQCRVEISEEDYVLIASGMPQKLIPPQPILEDEEKELGVMEILERNLGKVVQMADQVSARARQLNHKLKNRRSAILARREAETDPQRTTLRSNESPSSPVDLSGLHSRPARSIETSQSPPLGFTPVNVRQSLLGGAEGRITEGLKEATTSVGTDPPTPRTPVGINGRSASDATQVVRPDNISKFLTESEKKAGMTEDTVRRASLPPPLSREAMSAARARNRADAVGSGSAYGDKGSPSVAIPNTPASLMPQTKPNVFQKDDGGPFKAEMVARMENMARGERIIPPCDRCRRLQMDCMKNLTACQGCTKKHAKCSWKDVTIEELKGNTTLHIETPVSGAQDSDTMSVEPTARDWDKMLKEKDREQTSHPPQDSDPMEVASVRDTEAQVTSPPARSARAASQASPKLDVRPPPLEQLRETAEGRHQQRQQQQQGQYMTSAYGDTRGKARSVDIDADESDRLQALARQVYRSASQSVRPNES